MLNKDLQQILQNFPDDMEVLFQNGQYRVVTKVKRVQGCLTTIKGTTDDGHIVCNREDVILLKGVIPYLLITSINQRRNKLWHNILMSHEPSEETLREYRMQCVVRVEKLRQEKMEKEERALYEKLKQKYETEDKQ